MNLAPEMNLALFGFWLLNACPLLSDETDESREWTVLLLVDGASTRVSISCGYRAEVWVSTEMWNQIIPDATALISKQKPLKAVLHLIQRSEKLFETAWQHAKQQLQSNSTR